MRIIALRGAGRRRKDVPGVGDRSLLYTAEQGQRFDEDLRKLRRVRAEASEAHSSTVEGDPQRGWV